VSQGFVALEMNLAYYSGFNRVWEIGFGGMDNNCVAISMVAGTGLAFFLGLRAPTWWQKGLALAAALLMVHTIMFSMSRGGMLALMVTGLVAFLLLPKQAKHYLFFAVALALAVKLAGPSVRDRLGSAFADKEARDYSAQSRLDLWSACWDVMLKHPIFGVGPAHWPLIAPKYGFPLGKEAHTLWLQIGAEVGFVGLMFLVSFYGLSMARLRPLLRGGGLAPDPFLQDVARMVIAALAGFVIAAQFVTIVGLEAPYYIALLGAGALKLASAPDQARSPRSTWQAAPRPALAQ
jgi:O-antigen ligase